MAAAAARPSRLAQRRPGRPGRGHLDDPQSRAAQRRGQAAGAVRRAVIDPGRRGQVAEPGAVRGAEDPLERPGQRGCLQGREDAAAVVAGDDQGEVGPRLGRARRTGRARRAAAPGRRAAPPPGRRPPPGGPGPRRPPLRPARRCRWPPGWPAPAARAGAPGAGRGRGWAGWTRPTAARRRAAPRPGPGPAGARSARRLRPGSRRPRRGPPPRRAASYPASSPRAAVGWPAAPPRPRRWRCGPGRPTGPAPG